MPDLDAKRLEAAVAAVADSEGWNEADMLITQRTARAAVEAYIAALPSPSGVKVRELEWVDTDQRGFLEARYYAIAGTLQHSVHPVKSLHPEPFFEHYAIENRPDETKPWRLTFWVGNSGRAGITGSFATLESAKAAAQADFDQRIRSALSPSGEDRIAEPVAWQDISTAPKDGSRILAICMEAQHPTASLTWWGGKLWMTYSKPDKFITQNPHGWFPTHWMPFNDATHPNPDRIAELEKALEPFASRCDEAVRPDDRDNDGVTVKVKHLRAARRAKGGA